MTSYVKEKIMKNLFFTMALLSVFFVALICLFVFAGGLPAMFKIGIGEFLFGTTWTPTDSPAQFGILPMILGSIYVTFGATLIGVPLGVLTAVFMAYFCPKKLYRVLKPALDLLAGIPSIVYGFFGLMVLVPSIQAIFGGNGKSMLTASVLLGIMMLPTIIGISETALKAVPKDYYEGALALGASHQGAIYFVVLPAAKSGVFAAIILGIGRTIGETMAVVMVAGNQEVMPRGILKGLRTLTANIVMEMGYAVELHRDALIATGAVLFLFILLINYLFFLMKKKTSY